MIFIFNSEKHDVSISVGEVAGILELKIKMCVKELLEIPEFPELQISLPVKFKDTKFVQSDTLLHNTTKLSNEFFKILDDELINVSSVQVK